MKRCFLFIILVLCAMFVWFLPANVAYSQDAQFFETLQDVPLMPGLEEIAEEALSFDKAGGRIVESRAHIDDIPAHNVLAYYSKSLPQFGWQKKSENNFVRGEEALDFSIENEGNFSVFVIRIQPR